MNEFRLRYVPVNVHDATTSLYHFSRHLTGPTLSPGNIVSELFLVTDVINWMSPLSTLSPLSTISTLYDPGVNWEESRVRMVLEDKGISAGERAERLMK